MTEPIKTWKVDEPYLAIGGSLLEGPAYDERSGELRWVDITEDKVYSLVPSQGPESLKCSSVSGNTITTLANIENSSNLLLAGAKYGFATFDTVTSEVSYYKDYFDGKETAATQKRYRANDGAIDAKGRILQGIMIDEKYEQPLAEGMLISLDLDGKIHRIAENVTYPNGLGWNTTNKIMYWAESASGNVYEFDYDLDTGRATGQRIFFHIDGENNVNTPDGLVVDEEDHIWLAVWGGSAVLRISPSGQVVGRVELPTRFITCLVFVGTELFITSAVEVDPENYPQSAKLQGNLYRAQVGVRGIPKFPGSLGD